MTLLRILMVLAGAVAMAQAETNAPEIRKMSLDDCVQSALEKNLDLRIARFNVPEALADLQGAYSGYDPTWTTKGEHDFNLSGGGYNSAISAVTPATSSDQNGGSTSLSGTSPWGLNYTLQGNIAETYGRSSSGSFDSSSGSASIILQQHLLKNFWIDSTKMTIQVNKNRVKYTEQGLKQTIMATVTTVEQAYYDLIAARENVTVQEKAVELAQQLVAENKKRVEVGALAPLDEKQAESQAATSQADLIAARTTLATQENTFKHLLSDDYVSLTKVGVQPTASLAAPIQMFDRHLSWSKGLGQRPDLLQARLDIEKQGVTLKYNYNQFSPVDLDGLWAAGGSTTREFSDALFQIENGSRPFYSYGAQLIFPLANVGARATFKKSKLELERLKLTLKNLEQNIMLAIDNDIRQAQSGYERAAATKAAREYATDALDAEQKKLESGKSTTYTVLQMQRDLTAARGAEIQALATYNKALAQLSLDEASTLERLAIKVELKSDRVIRFLIQS
jgi:outer membrane protein TolC